MCLEINKKAYFSSDQLTIPYQFVSPYHIMETKQSHWDYQIRAPFKKVIAWDTLFFVLGVGVGAGIGAFLATA